MSSTSISNSMLIGQLVHSSYAMCGKLWGCGCLLSHFAAFRLLERCVEFPDVYFKHKLVAVAQVVQKLLKKRWKAKNPKPSQKLIFAAHFLEVSLNILHVLCDIFNKCGSQTSEASLSHLLFKLHITKSQQDVRFFLCVYIYVCILWSGVCACSMHKHVCKFAGVHVWVCVCVCLWAVYFLFT